MSAILDKISNISNKQQNSNVSIVSISELSIKSGKTYRTKNNKHISASFLAHFVWQAIRMASSSGPFTTAAYPSIGASVSAFGTMAIATMDTAQRPDHVMF